jgi:hypothetical protein
LPRTVKFCVLMTIEALLQKSYHGHLTVSYGM